MVRLAKSWSRWIGLVSGEHQEIGFGDGLGKDLTHTLFEIVEVVALAIIHPIILQHPAPAAACRYRIVHCIMIGRPWPKIKQLLFLPCNMIREKP